jgi:hypothetical protein
MAPRQQRGAALQQAVGRLAFGQGIEERGLVRPGSRRPIGMRALVLGLGRTGIIRLPGAVVGHWCGGIVVRSHPRLS